MQVGLVGGVLAAALLVPSPPQALGQRLLGGCLLVYGGLGLFGRSPLRWPAKTAPAMGLRMRLLVGLLVGGLTGLVTGLTGVFVLPAVPYLQSFGLDKDRLSQALGLCFTTSTLALTAVLAWRGHLDRQASLASLLLIVPAVAGLWAGQALRATLSEAVFRRCFFIGLTVLGGGLLAR